MLCTDVRDAILGPDDENVARGVVRPDNVDVVTNGEVKKRSTTRKIRLSSKHRGTKFAGVAKCLDGSKSWIGGKLTCNIAGTVFAAAFAANRGSSQGLARVNGCKRVAYLTFCNPSVARTGIVWCGPFSYPCFCQVLGVEDSVEDRGWSTELSSTG